MPAEPRTLDFSSMEDPRTHERLTAEEQQLRLDRIFWDDELDELPKQSFILDQWIPVGGLTMLTGHGNSGKTLVGLQWAMSIVTGTPWGARNTEGVDDPYKVVEKGNVLYLTQEGINGIQPRRQAWMKLHGVDKTKGFAVYPAGFKLGVPPPGARPEVLEEIDEGWDRLAELIAQVDPVVVFVDPFADYLSPGDENANRDVAAWVSRLRGMLNGGVSVVLMAHTAGHEKSGGENRGATALYDGADRSYTVSPTFPAEDRSGDYKAKGNPTALMVSCTKSKDGSRPSPWYGAHVQMEAPAAAMNREGQRVSVTLSPISQGEYAVHEARNNQSSKSGVSPTGQDVFRTKVLARDSITTAEAYELAPTVNKNTVRGWLSKMEELESVGHGEYRKVTRAAEEPETL